MANQIGGQGGEDRLTTGREVEVRLFMRLSSEFMRSAGGCGTPAQTIIDPEIGSHHHPRFVPIAILLHSFIHKAADASHNGFRFIRPLPNATKNKICPSGSYHVMKPCKGRVSELWIRR